MRCRPATACRPARQILRAASAPYRAARAMKSASGSAHKRSARRGAAPADPARLEAHKRRTSPGEKPGDRAAGNAAADDGDVYLQVAAQGGARAGAPDWRGRASRAFPASPCLSFFARHHHGRLLATPMAGGERECVPSIPHRTGTVPRRCLADQHSTGTLPSTWR